MSRNIEDLLPDVQNKYYQWAALMDVEGIDFLITCTRRTQAEQDKLYAQGRTAPGRIVTWTRNSKHIHGKAFDFVIMEYGKPDWCIENPKWNLAGMLGEDVGLTWGGSWTKRKDYPHFEVA